MRLADVDEEKIGVVLMLLIEVFNSARLLSKWRSSV